MTATAAHSAPSPAALPPVLTVQEVSDLMGCQPATVESEIRRRLLPAVKMGHTWRVLRDPLLAELNRRAAAHVAGATPAGTNTPKRRAALRVVAPPAVPGKRRHSPPPLADPPATGIDGGHRKTTA